MEKDNLKYLITQMHDCLVDKINASDNIQKDDVVSFLRNSIDVITSVPEEPQNMEVIRSAFDDAYKEVANKSISSYKHTNQKFQQIVQLHEETITTCVEEDVLDTSKIAEKFQSIQTFMVDEVKKANDIISQLSSQVEQLEKESNIDSLTKVHNRRALTSFLNNVCEKTHLSSELHLVVLDIDDFKLINDKYGHIAGDKILIFIAKILKKTLRDSDKVFRYGGEEFVLILNRIDRVHCEKIMLRILDLISQNQLIYKGENLSVTVSMGTTIFNDGDTPDSIIARADKALYRAKNDGKNRFDTELANGD